METFMKEKREPVHSILVLPPCFIYSSANTKGQTWDFDERAAVSLFVYPSCPRPHLPWPWLVSVAAPTGQLPSERIFGESLVPSRLPAFQSLLVDLRISHARRRLQWSSITICSSHPFPILISRLYNRKLPCLAFSCASCLSSRNSQKTWEECYLAVPGRSYA